MLILFLISFGVIAWSLTDSFILDALGSLSKWFRYDVCLEGWDTCQSTLGYFSYYQNAEDLVLPFAFIGATLVVSYCYRNGMVTEQ